MYANIHTFYFILSMAFLCCIDHETFFPEQCASAYNIALKGGFKNVSLSIPTKPHFHTFRISRELRDKFFYGHAFSSSIRVISILTRFGDVPQVTEGRDSCDPGIPTPIPGRDQNP